MYFALPINYSEARGAFTSLLFSVEDKNLCSYFKIKRQITSMARNAFQMHLLKKEVVMEFLPSEKD